MSNLLSIKLENVSKSYTLYGSQRDQLLSTLNFTKIGFKLKSPKKEFIALNDISLEIPKGQRVGIIGRNGSGKTTLLKLIGQNYSPTSGKVSVTGKIQSLMTSGVGFHEESTGRENIHTALSFNDLPADRYDQIVEDIIEFCELGEFIDQPFKTYSLGMQSRLQFACVTAVKPDILIVDEVLGAGDVYFSVKSASRMEKLVESGANLILVSHSMGQVLQYCERVIWIDSGKLIQDGKAIDVVKNYEKYMFDLSSKLNSKKIPNENDEKSSAQISEDNEFKTEPIPEWYREKLVEEYSGVSQTKKIDASGETRWINDARLKIDSFKLMSSDQKNTRVFETAKPFSVQINISANEPGNYDCWFLILIYGKDGRSLIRSVSKKYIYNLKKNEQKSKTVRYDKLLLNKGEYHISIAIYKKWEPFERSSKNWYEILSRSVEFKVVNDADNSPAVFSHPHSWND